MSLRFQVPSATNWAMLRLCRPQRLLRTLQTYLMPNVKLYQFLNATSCGLRDSLTMCCNWPVPVTHFVFISGNVDAVACTLLAVFSRNFNRQQDGVWVV